MMKVFNLLTPIIVMLLLAQAAYSEELPISASLRLYGTYIDNIFQTALPEQDYVSLTYLNTSYNLAPGASIFYNANLNLFSEHPDLRSHKHHLGFDYEKGVSEGSGALYLGGKIGLRQNTSEYDPYNHRSGGVYTALKYYLTETIMGRIGYSIDYEDYPNYRTSSFLENYGFAQFSKFLQTRTTLQMTLDAGRREYPNLNGENGGAYATQVTATAKIAQSLTDYTGLQLQYSWHHAPRGVADDLYVESDYYSVEDFLDDEYSYSDSEYKAVLKHLGPWRTTLKGTFSRSNRIYNTLYVSDGDDRRKDGETSLLLEIEKGFSLPLGPLPDFALHIQFLHRENNSNDPYYDYSMNIFSIGTKFAF